MIAVGIPTYNEVDSIGSLVRAVDAAAKSLKVPIVIINSDNCSPDQTSSVFKNTATSAEKVSLTTSKRGKGHNIKAIFEYIIERPEITGCILIDGDVTSFQDDWLGANHRALSGGADYVVPRYKRLFLEGNTTNHFIYPLLAARLSGKSLRQPICGDFGLSSSMISHLLSVEWGSSTLGYGVDIFMTMNAVYGEFLIKEIALGKKIHKPGFGKMTDMFVEVATSYYKLAEALKQVQPRSSLELDKVGEALLPATSLPADLIKERRSLAIGLLQEGGSLISRKPKSIHAKEWVEILIEHESMIGRESPETLAKSILPWFLLRVTEYLEEVSDPASATKEIEDQCSRIVEAYEREFINNETSVQL